MSPRVNRTETDRRREQRRDGRPTTGLPRTRGKEMEGKKKEREKRKGTIHARLRTRKLAHARPVSRTTSRGRLRERYSLRRRRELGERSSTILRAARPCLVRRAAKLTGSGLADLRLHLPRGDYSNRLPVHAPPWNRRGSVNAASMGDFELKGRSTRTRANRHVHQWRRTYGRYQLKSPRVSLV